MSSTKQPNDNPALADFEIVINNALISFNHPSIVKDDSIAPTPVIAKKFFNAQKKGSGLLPPVIRSISSDFTWVMVERSPMTVKLNYTTKYRSQPVEFQQLMQFTLHIPWTVWVMHFSTRDYTELIESYIYFRNSVISSDEEILYTAPLPNIYPDNSKICGAKDINKTLKKSINKGDLAQAINGVISSFWDSNFNEDMQTPWHGPNDDSAWNIKGMTIDEQYIGLLNCWQEKSEEEILDTKFDIAKITMPNGQKNLNGIATVGTWINYIDSLGNTHYYANSHNPLLTFFNRLKS